jgi:glycosyltransferase involved in cell wall biosynthesis
MMRIALLGPANSVHLQRWAHALVERGHPVGVFTQHACDRSLLPATADVFVLPHRGASGYFTNALRARKLLRCWRPDIVNAHYASGYGTTAALCGVRPMLLSVWGSDVYDFPYESELKGWLIRRTLRQATAVASTSHAMARQVQRLTPERSEVAVTPFGVDLAWFAPLPKAERPLTIGTVKSLAPKYGVDLLLRAFAGFVADAEVQTVAADCRLLVVGDGPQRAELEALARELGIAQRTEFAGAVAHAAVPAWLNRLDIYAAPSRLDSESFGVAVIEASACALPVIVSDVGGLPEVVRDHETGLIVPRDDVPALQAALRRLALDAVLRGRLGRAGREHVEREYEWGHCVDVMERCLQGVARARAGAR